MEERIWQGYGDTQGYFSVNLSRAKKVTVHRLVCEAFHGPAPKGKNQVAHYDGDKQNNRAENLRWADFLDNRADGRRLGEIYLSERHWKAKLTADDVRAIRAEVEAFNGRSGKYNQVAKRWGLTRSYVRSLSLGAARPNI
jgi:uncharacterized lipoprotein YmbA